MASRLQQRHMEEVRPATDSTYATSRHHSGDWIAVGGEDRAVADAAQDGVGIDAEEVEDGCGKVVGADRVFRGVGAVFVGGAVDEAALHARAGEERGVALWPMIATGVGVDLGRAA